MSLDCWSDNWTNRINGAHPIAEIGHADASESYEMDMMHVFQLSDGHWVIVRESGCSCYDSSQADVEFLPLNKAIDAYIAYKKDNGIQFTNLEYLEFKSKEKEIKDELLNRNIDPPTIL